MTIDLKVGGIQCDRIGRLKPIGPKAGQPPGPKEPFFV